MKIIHVFRAPVGGLFRHVVDLANGQIARGHSVGLIVDSRAGNAQSDAILAALEPKLALGLLRIPMRRQPNPADLATIWRVAARIKATGADILHGHGAKGGALARLARAPKGTVRAYTPHGGSLHDSLGGMLYTILERALMRRGNLYLFESAYSHDVFCRKIGRPPGTVQIVHNGVAAAEFEPIALVPAASDLVFLGELRALKGVDILLNAVASLRADGRELTVTIIGDGPLALKLQKQAEQLRLGGAVRFESAMQTRQALARGRIVVIPSRAESLPYVVLEAAAAAKPIVASNVGGIPEIFGPLAGTLVPADDAIALSRAIAKVIDEPATAARNAQLLSARVADLFSVDRMVEAVISAYQQALSAVREAKR